MASSMVNCFDIVMFLITITALYGGVLALQSAQSWADHVASSVKSSLEQKGVHVCSRGVSMKIERYYDHEDYINLHRRLGYTFACNALAKYPNHRVVLPLQEPSCSVQ